MNKLNLLGISSILLANAAFAGGVSAPKYSHPEPKKTHHHHHQPAAFTGFSLMGGVGGVGLNLETNQDTLSTFIMGESGTILQSANPDAFARNVAGLLGVGYGYQARSGAFVGVYVTANTNYAEFEDSVNMDVSVGSGMEELTLSNNIQVKLENDFALLFKPGFVMSNRTLLYALVGPRWGNFNSTLNANFDEVITGFLPPSPSVRDHSEEYVLGITAGVGISQMLSDHFQAGIEYAYTSYGDLDSLSAQTSETEGGESVNLISTTTLEANTNTLLATFTYKF